MALHLPHKYKILRLIPGNLPPQNEKETEALSSAAACQQSRRSQALQSRRVALIPAYQATPLSRLGILPHRVLLAGDHRERVQSTRSSLRGTPVAQARQAGALCPSEAPAVAAEPSSFHHPLPSPVYRELWNYASNAPGARALSSLTIPDRPRPCLQLEVCPDPLPKDSSSPNSYSTLLSPMSFFPWRRNLSCTFLKQPTYTPHSNF